MEAVRNVACKCSLVSLDREADLLVFIDENTFTNVRAVKHRYYFGGCRLILDTFLWKETVSEWCHTANAIPPSGLLWKCFLRQQQTLWQIVQTTVQDPRTLENVGRTLQVIQK